MNATLDAFLRSWPSEPVLLLSLCLAAFVYLRGFRRLYRYDPESWSRGKAAAFLVGLGAIGVALASPLEPFSSLLLQLHMVQHLLLMMVAPALLWLGAPLLPVLWGLPRDARLFWIAPVLRARWLRRWFEQCTHPMASLAIFTTSTWGWHTPWAYELALRSPQWHYLQHICFLGSGLLFWYPIIRPVPSRPRWNPWLLIPYLLLADLQNTALSAALGFADHVLYPYYLAVPRVAGISALEDQSAAALLMWVPGTLVFLLPLLVIGVQLLAPSPARRAGGGRRAAVVAEGTAKPLNLLEFPLLGRFLRWRHARLLLQTGMALLAAIVIWDGWRGPAVGPMNLAGILPWIHWRGLVILGLLVAGNVFCMACPFQLPRTLGRRYFAGSRRWPRVLRGKWLAIILLVVYFWAYESFALWDHPAWTAAITLLYFAAAMVTDGLFQGAAFCKYVCPIGQFNFVQSLVSPLEIRVLNVASCATCKTRDCIRGRDDVSGCEMGLFLPRKQGNMDCTFCLDCIQACPHQNVGLLIGPPGKTLWTDRVRSGIGRMGVRVDLAALVVILVFGAFANAAAMVAPVADAIDHMRCFLPLWTPTGAVNGLFFLLSLAILPLFALAATAELSRRLSGSLVGRVRLATRFAFALVPLGFGMWLAHYCFHFFTSYGTLLPGLQRFCADHGWTGLGSPRWVTACAPASDGLLHLEIIFLDLGLLLSLYTGYRIAEDVGKRQVLRMLAPWAILILGLFAAGVWLVLQPMQMRGTMLM